MAARVVHEARRWLAASPFATVVAIAAAAPATGTLGREPSAHEPRPGKRPNVLVIMTDDQNASDLWVMRHVRHDLAARGVTFERFYATFPLCCPSRVSFLTGQYAHNTGVVGNNEQGNCGPGTVLSPFNLGTALQRAGYRTGYFGKYLNGYSGFAGRFPAAIPHGWSRWLAITHPISGVSRSWAADDQGRIRHYRGDPTRAIGAAAARYIARSARAGRPFFAWVATHAPHSDNPPPPPGTPNPRPAPRDQGAFAGRPLPRPPSFNEPDVSDKPPFLRLPRLDAEQIAHLRDHYVGRLESLLAVDRMVHRLVARLRSLGELDRTWIVFTSDNGYLLGEHRIVKKRALYEEAVRVPFVIRGPRGALPAGAVRRQIAGNVDLAPTLFAITGARPLRPFDGISLLPLARDPAAAAHRAILLENLSKSGVSSRAIRSPRWTLIEHRTGGGPRPDAFELYDMRRDPYQLRNLYGRSLEAARHPRLAAARRRLERRLAGLARCAGHRPPRPCR